MAWPGNGMGAAWAWHAMCESAFIILTEDLVFFLNLSRNLLEYYFRLGLVCFHVLSLLGVCTKLRRVTVSFIMSVHLSIRKEQLSYHCTDFY
jgi:hypothetical protein